jgi:hypothetical protein
MIFPVIYFAFFTGLAVGVTACFLDDLIVWPLTISIPMIILGFTGWWNAIRRI